ncbi:MAG: DUF2784 domain-containing protein [Desulfobacterota bacterium]|nr:DUF2784 domain-containing protein [Thermodesulfobacteriota bacterium]
MGYKLLADFTVWVHLLWILFLLTGALWGRRHKWIRAFHLLGLAFALLIQLLGWYCPLTHIEAWLRARHHPDLTYTGSFIIHYAERIIYIEIAPGWILVATLLLIGFHLWIYLRKWVKIGQ